MKPCPFCGKTPKFRLRKIHSSEQYGDSFRDYIVECVSLICEIKPKIIGCNKEDLKESWDKRR